MADRQFTVSASPHIRGNQTTQVIMRDVLIALLPACIWGVIRYGLKALILFVVGVASAVASEYICQKIMKKPSTIADLSAAVTGLLLAMNMPVGAPWWMLAIGCAFAIIIVKQLFGGLGCNFVNPALAARLFLVASYPTLMTGSAFIPATEATTSATAATLTTATPLVVGAEGTPLLDLFLGTGDIHGCIGEISALALLIGFAYLLYRNVISYRIPVAYIGTVAVFSLLAGQNVPFQLCAGGLMLGAIFMATDYVTSPSTPLGELIYAVGCGLMTCIIRFYGGYPEGVSYSIMFMNLVTPLLDKYIKAKKYGEVKKNA
ncbi:MAG: RnfABCDGE type electron transport complex subunit D [Anaerofustis stercorihominis]|nr:RnfABCDGE type electron transport complex subunit D [Anaerofustis stercorihominis]